MPDPGSGTGSRARTANAVAAPGTGAARRWRAVVLAGAWDEPGEPSWYARQLAGALALRAEVAIVTTGDVPAVVADGAFTVHRLGGRDRRDELRRRLLLAALGSTTRRRPVPDAGPLGEDAAPLLEAFDGAGWSESDALFSDLHPDLVVVAGHDEEGAAALVRRAAPEVPMLWVPLLETGSPAHLLPAAHAFAARAAAVVVATEAERADLLAAFPHIDGTAVHVAPPAVARNPTAWREPVTFLADRRYVLVLCDSSPAVPGALAPQVRFLATAFPDHPVCAVHATAFEIFDAGTRTVHGLTLSSTDRARLMAWASVVVDLHPGPLLARQSVAALHYGVPIVVPDGSRARQHAEHGGLWYRDMAELRAGISQLLRAPELARSLGARGQRYVEATFGTRHAPAHALAELLDRIS